MGDSGGMNIEMRELPSPERLPGIEQMVEWLKDAQFREAVDMMEREAGAVSDLKLMVHRQLRQEMHDRGREYVQRRVIDLARRKREGTFLG